VSSPVAHTSPIRTCIACRTSAPQATLLRFERRATGDVALAGRAHDGRTAYVCPTQGCFERAVARHAFARAFQVPGPRTVSPKDRGTIGAPSTRDGAVRRPAAWPAVLEPWRDELRVARARGRLGRRHNEIDAVLARCEHGHTATMKNETVAPPRASVAPTERRLDGATDVRGEGGY
jgi:predicted RNA-binding protein YlxR (DUF448 family)